jgi:hypothetical protein
MGCQNSKNEEFNVFPSLEELSEQKKIRDDQKYQRSLRILEKHIKKNKKFKQDLINTGGEYGVIRDSVFLDQEKFNTRNISKIKTDKWRDLYSRFYPMRDEDLSNPRFL